MTDLDAHQRRGAHRARGNPWRAVLPSLLAVASVVSLIVALSVWRGQSEGGSPAAFDGGASTSATDAAVSARPTTAPPSASGSAGASSTTSSSESASTSAVPTMGVVVLNGSGRTRLGARVARTLRDAGWTVVAVGNFRGSVPATTVYYPSGHAADAQSLAAALPGLDRIRPRFGNLSTSRLTVVITASYPG